MQTERILCNEKKKKRSANIFEQFRKPDECNCAKKNPLAIRQLIASDSRTLFLEAAIGSGTHCSDALHMRNNRFNNAAKQNYVLIQKYYGYKMRSWGMKREKNANGERMLAVAVIASI